MSDWPFTLMLVAALGCGVIGGVFFAFSSFVMGALARLPAPQGIAAMQSINVVVINPVFLGSFFGTGTICLPILALGLARLEEGGALWLLSGGLLYLIGTIGVTMVCNVPRNNRMAALEPTSPEAEADWRRYVREWTAWNHVRTIAAVAAAACLSFGML